MSIYLSLEHGDFEQFDVEFKSIICGSLNRIATESYPTYYFNNLINPSSVPVFIIDFVEYGNKNWYITIATDGERYCGIGYLGGNIYRLVGCNMVVVSKSQVRKAISWYLARTVR